VDAEQAAAARTEIGRRLLAADSAARTEGDAAPPPRSKRTATAALLVLVPATALSLYAVLGRPDLVSSPNPHRVAGSAMDQPGMEALVAELARKLQDRPDDATGWTLYARSLAGMGRFKDAEPVFARALALDPDNLELASRYAEAQIFAAGGIVTPAARKTLDGVIARDPSEPRARFYLGLADMQAGNNEAARRRWLVLEAESPADAPWRPTLSERIARLAQERNIDAAALAAMRREAAARAGTRAAPGPSAADVEAAGAMSEGDRSAMIRSMVAQLAARLENEPDDAEGWMRLGRAYGVLNEPARARDAWAKAAARRPGDVTVQVAYLEALVNAEAQNATMPAEIGALAERILTLDPDQPSALWYAGMAKRMAGDKAGARALWTRLLGGIDPANPQHAELKRHIEALGGGTP
jgi:cytochrome c-type biogenesis protein CcmH